MQRFFCKLFSLVLFIISIPYFGVGFAELDIGMISGATFMLWGAVLLKAISKKKKNIIYIFYIYLFIFLLSRVMVRWINRGETYMPFDAITMRHIYTCLYLSLVGMSVGLHLKVKLFDRKIKDIGAIKRIDVALLRKITCGFAIVSGGAQLLANLEKIAYWNVLGSGGALRLSYSSSLPSIVMTFSYVYIFMLCIYLATFPKKKGATWMLVMYLTICAMKMVYGSRCDFVLGLMFVFVYFIIRDRLVKSGSDVNAETWIGRKEIVIVAVSIPLLIILVVFIGYYRTQSEFEFTGFWNTLLDFFESQGTSIDVLGYAYIYEEKIPQSHFLYLFDNLYTFITTNPASRIVFGTQNYNVNTLERALYGTSLDQTLYYIINPSSYLNGFGCGSSYVAEAYLAFGYVGVFMFNVILAVVLDKLYNYKFDVMWKNVIVFIFIQSLFFIPRAGFDDYLSDFLSMTHLMAFAILWFFYKLLRMRKN